MPFLQNIVLKVRRHGLSNTVHAFALQALNAIVPFKVLRGDAFFSRLEGEWWMRFAGEPQPAAKRGQDPFIEKGARSLAPAGNPAQFRS